MTQLVITNIEEDVIASRFRSIQKFLNEIGQDLEARTIGRNELVEKLKEVEKDLRQMRNRI